MSAIKQIQCPACGANSTYKKPDGTYHCNYCQGTFEIEEDKLKFDSTGQKKKELLEMLQNSQKQQSQAGIDMAKALREKQLAAATSGKKLGLIITMVTLLFVAGVLSFVFFQVKKSVGDVSSIFSDWQTPSLNGYQCYVGSKGPVAWLMYSQSRNKLDSAKYTIKIVDPVTQKVFTEKLQLPLMTWKESFDVSKQLGSQFFQIGDIAYNVSEDNGLVGFDIYNYEVKEDEESLGKKFKELKSGISKADYMWYKVAFNLTTNTGEEYVYYPEQNNLVTKKYDDKGYKRDTITTTDVYLSDEKQAQAYLVRIRRDKNRPELDIREDLVKDYEKEKSYYRSSYHISLLKKLNDKVYFKALPLFRYKNNLIVLYADNLSKKAKINLESIGDNGSSKWTNSDPTLNDLKSNSDKLNCEFHYSGNLLTLNIQSPNRKTLCFDLDTGKLLWSYSPSK